jgi:hypothetical protein
MSANDSNTDRSLIYDAGLHLGKDAEFYFRKGFRGLGIAVVAGHCARAQERLLAVPRLRTTYDSERGDNRPERSNPFFRQ